MNIRQLGQKFSYEVIAIRRKEREQRLGIKPFAHLQITHRDIPHLMRANVVEPIVKELCIVSKQKITFQVGFATGFYTLYVDGKPFTIMYMPNLSTGLIFVKFLNKSGQLCTSPKQLNDLGQITDYLKEYINSLNEPFSIGNSK